MAVDLPGEPPCFCCLLYLCGSALGIARADDHGSSNCLPAHPSPDHHGSSNRLPACRVQSTSSSMLVYNPQLHFKGKV